MAIVVTDSVTILDLFTALKDLKTIRDAASATKHCELVEQLTETIDELHSIPLNVDMFRAALQIIGNRFNCDHGALFCRLYRASGEDKAVDFEEFTSAVRDTNIFYANLPEVYLYVSHAFMTHAVAGDFKGYEAASNKIDEALQATTY